MAYRVIEDGEEGCDKIKISNKDNTFESIELSTDPEQPLFSRDD